MVPLSTTRLEQFIALNDEIAALARSGVPMPVGLREFGREYPGRVGRLSTALSERLEAGESLEAAVAHANTDFAPIYTAIVRAGIRSGRLPAALESLSTTVRRIADIRRSSVAALIYPLILLIVASLLFPFVSGTIVHIISMTYDRFDVARPEWYVAMLQIAGFGNRALPWFWVGMVVFIFVGLRGSRLSIADDRRWSICLPPLGRVLRAGRTATFAEILATLLENRAPMDEALILAADATGDKHLQRAANDMAQQIRLGDSSSALPSTMPPLVGWLLRADVAPERRVSGLRRMAGGYRRRMAYWGVWLMLYFPIFVSAAIGGAITLFYALLVMAPFYNLLYELSGSR
jgi:type II secretory pathway component PulF